MSLALSQVIPPQKLKGFTVGLIRLAFSGNYATGGDACDVNAVCNPGLLTQPSAVIPLPNPVAGWSLSWDKANKKMLVYVNTAGGANTALGEHTAAALNATLTGATIYALVIWFGDAF